MGLKCFHRVGERLRRDRRWLADSGRSRRGWVGGRRSGLVGSSPSMWRRRHGSSSLLGWPVVPAGHGQGGEGSPQRLPWAGSGRTRHPPVLAMAPLVRARQAHHHSREQAQRARVVVEEDDLSHWLTGKRGIRAVGIQDGWRAQQDSNLQPTDSKSGTVKSRSGGGNARVQLTDLRYSESPQVLDSGVILRRIRGVSNGGASRVWNDALSICSLPTYGQAGLRSHYR